MQQGHQPSHDIEEHIRIGDLLTEAGIVTRGDVVESIQISKRMNLPIGRVLVMSGVLTELLLTAALQVQDLLRENKLTMDQAYQTLQYVHANQSTLDAAMEALDCKPSADLSRSKLGLLLVDSDIVTPQQVEEALAASFGSGIPLGSMLVLQGMLSAQLLPGILDAQERLRAGRINHTDAVAEIRTQFDYWAHANESKADLLSAFEQGSMPGLVAPSGLRVASTASNRDPGFAAGAGKDKKKSGKREDKTGPYPQLIITGEHPAAMTGQNRAIADASAGTTGAASSGSAAPATGKGKGIGETGKDKAIGETGKHKAIADPSAAGAAGKAKPTAEAGKYKPVPDSGGKHKVLSDNSYRDSLEETGSYDAIGDTGAYGSIGEAGKGTSSRRRRSIDKQLPASKQGVVVPLIPQPEVFHLENNEALSMLSLLEMGGFGVATRDKMLDAAKAAFRDAETTIRLAQVLGILSRRQIEAAVLCYQLVSQWKLTIPEAVGVLAEVRVTGEPVENVLAKHHLNETED
jgi:hypothetical protein